MTLFRCGGSKIIAPTFHFLPTSVPDSLKERGVLDDVTATMADCPRQPILLLHALRAVLVIGGTLLPGSSLLQQSFLRVALHPGPGQLLFEATTCVG